VSDPAKYGPRAALLAASPPVAAEGLADAWFHKIKAGEADSAIAGDDFGYRILALSLRDGAGDRLFGDDDIAVMKQIEQDRIGPLLRQALRLNGLDVDAIETAAKN
jgi:hypothetical protein